ncbi:MAG TPA: 2-octaprenyl-6-methoxyphenyl hydroxylase, partial [Haliea salexigens]|nr:2-octaprenyl-6-methoxyphenyl hydroxylase [Haliea salexigens]
LGHVVENAWLGQALLHALRAENRVELLNPARVVDAKPGREGVTLSLDGDGPAALTTALLVVADGADSGLRQRLGVAATEKPYRQHALICNVATAEPHAGCA